MKIELAEDLEKALLRAVAEGVCTPDVVQADELSKKADKIYQSIKYLIEHRAKPPLKPASILLTAVNVFGAPEDGAREYLKSFKSLQAGAEIKQILRAAREKAALVAVINEAGSQLASGNLKASALLSLLESKGAVELTKSLAEDVGKKFKKPPSGIPLWSVPALSEMTNGLFGIWVIGGEPGLGKSTFACQLGLDVSKSGIDVDYLDIDGTGKPFVIDRIRRVVKGKLPHFKKLTEHFYYHEDVAAIEMFAAQRKPPAVLIVDSVQTLPTSIKYSKQSLDEWVKRFKGLTRKGFGVLLVSEKQRAEYGQASLGGFKNSGNIEYSGSVCIQLLADENDDDVVQCWLVKNRHGTAQGHVIDLERDSKREFWFQAQKVA